MEALENNSLKFRRCEVGFIKIVKEIEKYPKVIFFLVTALVLFFNIPLIIDLILVRSEYVGPIYFRNKYYIWF